MKGDYREREIWTRRDLITVDLFRLSLGITSAITQAGRMTARMRDGEGPGGGGGGGGNQVDLIRKHVPSLDDPQMSAGMERND